MKNILLIFRNNELYKKIDFKQRNDGLYVCKWSNIESGSYSFSVEDENGSLQGVTYNHTAPFATDFEAKTEENVIPKPITGFQKGLDILVTYDSEKNKILFSKTKFYRMILDIKDFNLEKADEMKISGVFNGWIGDSEPIHHIEGTLYEIELALSEGTYEYKYLIDNEWYPKNENLKLIIGENGALFPQGDIGTGKFVFEAIDRKTNLKAIVHNYESLKYFNKLSDREYEFKIRTQMNDV